MKKIIIILSLATGMAGQANAQVGIGTTTPEASLDIHPNDVAYTSGNGVLVPRVAAVPTASGNDEGELVYVNGTGFHYWDGNSWEPIAAGGGATASGAWLDEATGSSATTSSTDIYFNNGNIGVGTTVADKQFQIGTTFNANPGSFTVNGSETTNAAAPQQINSIAAFNGGLEVYDGSGNDGQSLVSFLGENNDGYGQVGLETLVTGSDYDALTLSTFYSNGDNNSRILLKADDLDFPGLVFQTVNAANGSGNWDTSMAMDGTTVSFHKNLIPSATGAHEVGTSDIPFAEVNGNEIVAHNALRTQGAVYRKTTTRDGDYTVAADDYFIRMVGTNPQTLTLPTCDITQEGRELVIWMDDETNVTTSPTPTSALAETSTDGRPAICIAGTWRYY